MAKHIQEIPQPNQEEPLENGELQVPAPQDAALEEILSDIDSVLEANALTFVQDFKQKGGQ